MSPALIGARDWHPLRLLAIIAVVAFRVHVTGL
jgi:hypothetical protein